MIDPGNIIPIDIETRPTIKSFKDIPEPDFEDYDIFDDKDFKRYVQDVEKMVRNSREYKRLIKYLRENMGMDRDIFYENVSNADRSKMKIEIHHTPFDLYTIVQVVIQKRLFYSENMDIEMVSKEVMELHYKLMIGLVPLSTTAHELVHNKYLFVPTDRILGRYNLFVDYYKDFMTQEMIDTLDRIEEYTKTYQDSLQDKAPLIQNEIKIDTSEVYGLPNFEMIQNAMKNRVQEIKDNNYQLPTLEDKQRTSKSNDNYDNNTKYIDQLINPISFVNTYNGLINPISFIN